MAAKKYIQTLRNKNLSNIIPLAVFLVAFAVRLWRLNAQSFWGDEVASAMISSWSVKRILGLTILADVNPPAFYILLHFWRLFSESDWWLRVLPALFGALSAPLIYAFCKRFITTRIGLIAGVLYAFCPLTVYFSHELRYQSMLTFFTLISFYSLLVFLDSNGKRGRLLYILSTAFAFYTHYTFLFLFAAQVAYIFIALLKNRSLLWKSVKYLVLISALFLPGVLVALFQFLKGNTAIKSLFPASDIIHNLRSVLIYLTVGHSPNRVPTFFSHLDGIYSSNGMLFWALLLFFLSPIIILSIYGLWMSFTAFKESRIVSYYLAIPLFLPLIINPFIPVFDVKLLVPMYPAFAVVVGMGISTVMNRRKALGIILVFYMLFLFSFSLSQYYGDKRYHRADWRGLARYIEQHERPGDALLSFAFELEYYYRGDSDFASVTGLNLRELKSQGFQMTPEQVQQQVDFLLSQYDRYWIKLNNVPIFPWLDDLQDRIKQKTYDVTPRELTEFRIPLALWDTAKSDFEQYILSDGASAIDFDSEEVNRRQLKGKWLVGEDGWAWTTNSSSAFLPLPQGADTVEVEVFANTDYFSDSSANITLILNGNEADRKQIESSERFTLHGAVPADAKVIEVSILSDRAIEPDIQNNISDDQARTVLVKRIDVQ